MAALTLLIPTSITALKTAIAWSYVALPTPTPILREISAALAAPPRMLTRTVPITSRPRGPRARPAKTPIMTTKGTK